MWYNQVIQLYLFFYIFFPYVSVFLHAFLIFVFYIHYDTSTVVLYHPVPLSDHFILILSQKCSNILLEFLYI